MLLGMVVFLESIDGLSSTLEKIMAVKIGELESKSNYQVDLLVAYFLQNESILHVKKPSSSKRNYSKWS
jgi:hypothetical protein